MRALDLQRLLVLGDSQQRADDSQHDNGPEGELVTPLELHTAQVCKFKAGNVMSALFAVEDRERLVERLLERRKLGQFN